MGHKYYAILRGRRNRYIAYSWVECKALVENYPGAIYKSFDTWKEAAIFLNYKLDPNRNYVGFNSNIKYPIPKVMIDPIRFLKDTTI